MFRHYPSLVATHVGPMVEPFEVPALAASQLGDSPRFRPICSSSPHRKELRPNPRGTRATDEFLGPLTRDHGWSWLVGELLMVDHS